MTTLLYFDSVTSPQMVYFTDSTALERRRAELPPLLEQGLTLEEACSRLRAYATLLEIEEAKSWVGKR